MRLKFELKNGNVLYLTLKDNKKIDKKIDFLNTVDEYYRKGKDNIGYCPCFIKDQIVEDISIEDIKQLFDYTDWYRADYNCFEEAYYIRPWRNYRYFQGLPLEIQNAEPVKLFNFVD